MSTEKISNLSAIKQEFERDEKILENAFRLERLFKKYKYWILGIGLILIAWIAYISIYNILQEHNAEKTSALYNELLENPNNELLRKSLQEQAPELYDLYILNDALGGQEEASLDTLKALANSTNVLVKQIALYELASLQRENLNTIHGAFQDFAKIQESYLLLVENNIEKARKILDTIPQESPLFGIATQMKHYGIKDFPLQDLKDMRIQEVEKMDSATKVQDSPKQQ